MSSTPPASDTSANPLQAVFAGRSPETPPVWLMRQAGRYLPEYRQVRADAGSFLDLCYAPELAAEVTLQPIRRYDFDAAILFADILIVPDALGQDVRFVAGEGPRLVPVNDADTLARLDPAAAASKFDTICETVSRVRQALAPEKALIGFCGAPWTVATYMVGGRGSPDQADARLLAYADPDLFANLIELLEETSVTYLSGQIGAGADIVQIFDTWAGSLPDNEFERWVIEPTARIVHQLKQRHPDVPVIGFPRGAGPLMTAYVERTGVDGVGCDTALSLDYIRERLAPVTAIQGNLDPLLLVAGGRAMDERIDGILQALRGTRHIFNLGHGITPQTPPENVSRLVARVRGASS